MLEGKKGCGKSFGRSDGFRGVVFNHCLPLPNPHKSKIYDNILSSQSFVPAQSSHRVPLKPSHLHWLPPDSSTTSHRRYILVQTLQLSSNSFLLLPLFPSFKLQGSWADQRWISCPGWESLGLSQGQAGAVPLPHQHYCHALGRLPRALARSSFLSFFFPWFLLRF